MNESGALLIVEHRGHETGCTAPVPNVRRTPASPRRCAARRDVSSWRTSLFGTSLLGPNQTLGSDPAAGTPAAGATDPNGGVANATQDVSSLAQTAQQSDPGASAQNIDSADSVSSATTPTAGAVARGSAARLKTSRPTLDSRLLPLY